METKSLKSQTEVRWEAIRLWRATGAQHDLDLSSAARPALSEPHTSVEVSHFSSFWIILGGTKIRVYWGCCRLSVTPAQKVFI